MKRISFRPSLLGLLLLLAVAALTGCVTTESENVSARPWGYRSGYDPGVPGLINEGK